MESAIATNIVLEVRDLSYSYGKFQALDAIDFTVKSGEFTIFLGPNGAGKTTLFSLITGLYYSHQGKVLVKGYNMRYQQNRAMRHVGVVFQQRSLDMDLTVWQNLKYAARLYGLSLQEAKERTEEEVNRLGLLDQMDKKIRSLSGGQARRIEIARALINRPDLLILDEPTVGLDMTSRNAIIQHIRGLCEQGLSVLWTTHLLDEIKSDDYLLVVNQGRLIKKGRANEIAATENPELLKQRLTDLL